MEIFDRDRELRATIVDGEIKNSKGELVGYVEPNGSCGDVDQNFVGEINDSGQILNNKDEVIGSVDEGNGELRDDRGSFVGLIKAGGDILDDCDGYRGKVDNFDFYQLRIFAAYLFFFDLALIKDGESSKVVVEETDQHIVTDLPPPTDIPETKQDTEHIVVDLAMPPMPKVEPVIENRSYKPYKVGDFKSLPGSKNLLEITDCDVQPHQLKITLEKNGEQVVFQRTVIEGVKKEQVQRFSLPYYVTPKRIEVNYAPNTEGGKLSITLTKPESGSGPSNGEFCSFKVPASPNVDPSSKVRMSSSNLADRFQFDLGGSSKWETEVIGELQGNVVKFHYVTVVTEERTKKKETQSITLPSQPSKIETTSNSVLLYKGTATNATREVVETTDIPINVV